MNKFKAFRVAQATALVSMLAVTGAQATYFKWETVTAPASSGAGCGNGTPYRFFVNRTPFSSKTIVIYEGGGACFGQQTCRAQLLDRGDPKNGVLVATDPNGISENYMTAIFSNMPNTSGSLVGIPNLALAGLVSPFAARLSPLGRVQTQKWNIVYAPYCTGDVHVGNKTNVYIDHDPSKPYVYHHLGYPNTKYMATWLGKNLSRPENLLVTGFSAGGFGAAANYDTVRRAMNPRHSALLDDGGPFFNAPVGSNASSLPLHTRIRKEWGTDGSQGILTELLARYPNSGGDRNNMGSLFLALAKVYPKDRFGLSTMNEDQIIPRFSYEPFFPEILEARPGKERDSLMNVRWRREIQDWKTYVAGHSNIGYYIPNARDLLLSHTLTVLTFGGTAIEEANQPSVVSFVDNLVEGSGPVLRAASTTLETQRSGLTAAYTWIVSLVLSVIGV